MNPSVSSDVSNNRTARLLLRVILLGLVCFLALVCGASIWKLPHLWYWLQKDDYERFERRSVETLPLKDLQCPNDWETVSLGSLEIRVPRGRLVKASVLERGLELRYADFCLTLLFPRSGTVSCEAWQFRENVEFSYVSMMNALRPRKFSFFMSRSEVRHHVAQHLQLGFVPGFENVAFFTHDRAKGWVTGGAESKKIHIHAYSIDESHHVSFEIAPGFDFDRTKIGKILGGLAFIECDRKLQKRPLVETAKQEISKLIPDSKGR